MVENSDRKRKYVSKVSFDANGNRIEKRGRPRKVKEVPILHWRTEKMREEQAPKLLEIQRLITESFGSMRRFLKAWMENNVTSVQRENFMQAGAVEMIEIWLPQVDSSRIVELLVEKVESLMMAEVNELVSAQNSVLRYKTDGTPSRITANFEDIEAHIKERAPILWGLFEKVANGMAKGKSSMVVLGSIMGLLNTRNQKVNAYQTLLGAFCYANNISKSGIEALAGLGICCSYRHLVYAIKEMSECVGKDMVELSRHQAMKVTLDNVNQMVGVRDRDSLRQSMMDNSTGGFVCPVRGMPESGLRFIPRAWKTAGERVKLDPVDLGPSDAALDYMAAYRRNLMWQLLEVDVGEGEKYKLPLVEVLEDCTDKIFPLELMRSEQASVKGNQEGIDQALFGELRYTKQNMAEGIVIVGRDQLLEDRVRTIQKLKEYDVPGENYQGVQASLGPLHTGMNFKKLMMRRLLGPRDGSRKGSLYYFNRKLKRQYIDEKLTNYWNLMDFTKDALEAVLRGLMVKAGGCLSWEQLRVRMKMKEIDVDEVIMKVDAQLEYSHVPILRMRADDERDRVLENILLFARMELESRAYYKAIRGGDVGAMNYILEFMGLEFLGGKASRYATAIMEIRVGMAAEWSEELKRVVRSNWLINPWGKKDKFLALDEFMEELVRAYKQHYNPGGSEGLDDHMRKVVAKCVVYFMRIKEDVRKCLGLRRHEGRHNRRDRSADVVALLEFLLNEGVLGEEKGRGKPIAGVGEEESEDLFEKGLVILLDGKWWPKFLARSVKSGGNRGLWGLGMSEEDWCEDILDLSKED